jgi:hypothetical protein
MVVTPQWSVDRRLNYAYVHGFIIIEVVGKMREKRSYLMCNAGGWASSLHWTRERQDPEDEGESGGPTRKSQLCRSVVLAGVSRAFSGRSAFPVNARC